MRIAVISDIHGNWHALEAVLADVEREHVDEVWCLGDIVGYGPQPNRCVEETRRALATLPARATTTSACVGEADLASLLT